MIYEERPAPEGLQDVVSRLWHLEVPRSRAYEKILPLPFVHMIVNLSAPYRLFDRQGGSIVVADAFVSGLQSEYLVIESPELIRHVGIELTPAGLDAFAPGAAAASAGRVRDARSVLGGIDPLVARLLASTGAADALDIVTAWALDSRSRDVDRLVSEALAAMEADHDATISSVAALLGVSHRTLIARFRAATGTTPKRHAQVLRFHRLIDTLPTSGDTPDWAGLAAESGYYDQPHVIRAFRRFSGWTPAEYHRLVSAHGPDAAHFVPLEQLPAQARS